MSYRYANAMIKPGLNTLTAPTPTYTYNLLAWGSGFHGQLGLGNTAYYSSPVQVGTLTNWKIISPSSGSSWVMSIKTDNTLWSWGYNGFGQLGLGNTTNYSSPVQVGALTNWLTISSGYGHVLATKTDGTLWSWGLNQYGQLGLGNITYRSSPVQVGLLTNWLTISAGYLISAAIKTDGTLWTWGGNNVGQLGLGNKTNYSSPKQVGALTNWSKIFAAGYANSFVLAIKTDGTLWSWGINTAGQLGLGNTTYYSSPKQVGALTNWSVPNTGFNFSVCIKTDGTMWSWGKNNNYGQLGLNNLSYYSSPKQVGALTTWLNASSGQYHTLATKTDGTIWTWSRNNNGQLGLGNTTNYSSPKQVGILTNWSKAAAGLTSSFALAY